MRPWSRTRADAEEKTELDGLARSIDALFSDAPAPPSRDDPASDTDGDTRTLVDALRNPRYDVADRQRALVVMGLMITVILARVLFVEAVHHEQHLAELSTDVCRRNIAAAGILASALVATSWAWLRARPKARLLLTLEEIRQPAPN